MKTALLIFSLSLSIHAAEPVPSSAKPVPKVDGMREEEAAWRAAEPDLFTPEGKKHIGTWVRCSGAPVSLGTPITLKLASGVIIRLTKLQGADREELKTFKKPPSVVTVSGPILAIDAPSHTVTIKAVSAGFDR